MGRRYLQFVALFCLPIAGQAGPLEDALKKLDPAERAHQACAIKGLDTLRREKRLPQADRMKTGVAGAAVFDGASVTAKGGAVRAKGRWYALKFVCKVTADQMEATSFSYELGSEIPESKWEAMGLWR
jgi:hypothetical protein